MTVLEQQRGVWEARRARLRDGAVGRAGENHVEQGRRIRRCLEQMLLGGFYRHGLDFGCGWGRFSGLLAEHCSHLWVVDIFQDWTGRAAATAPNITPVCLTGPKLPFGDGSMDLIVDIMTLQSIENDQLFLQQVDELQRVAGSGARIWSLYLREKAEGIRHVDRRAERLKLAAGWTVDLITDVDKAGSAYQLVVGCRA